MRGGIGVYLLISQYHFFSLKMGCGQSSNTRAQLLALWVLLVIAKIIGLPYLNIRGDSSSIINWFTGRADLSALNLDSWCKNIRYLESSFLFFYSCHMYREFKGKADALSKDALALASVLLLFSEFTAGECSGNGSLQLYQSILDLLYNTSLMYLSMESILLIFLVFSEGLSSLPFDDIPSSASLDQSSDLY